jgi:hypothetical protein
MAWMDGRPMRLRAPSSAAREVGLESRRPLADTRRSPPVPTFTMFQPVQNLS